MMKTLKRYYPLLVIVSLIFIQINKAQAEYSDIYVLGDSLSDTGNLSSIKGDFPFPFFENRISNGPVMVEILAQRLKLPLNTSFHLIGPAVGNNYAVAGARSVGNSGIDLQDQIDSLLANSLNTLPESALYVIMVGGNDIRNARDSSDAIMSFDIIHQSVRSIVVAISKLQDAGARHFLISNSLNIGALPETRLLADNSGSDFIIKKTTFLSLLFNSSLKVTLSTLLSGNIDIVNYDLFNRFNSLVKNSEAFGFTNNQDACFSSVTFTFNPDCNNGEFLDEFVFFDEIHPTARAHRFLGNFMFNQINSSRGLADSDF